MEIKEARELIENNHFEIMTPILPKSEMKKLEIAIYLAFKSLGLLQEVAEIVFSDDYPEDKEDKLVDLLQEYRKEK